MLFKRLIPALVVVVVCLSPLPVAHAQGDKAVDLRQNVVKVSAGADAENGFGFIVAQQDQRIFLVTAYHVVKDIDTPNTPAGSIKITFFADQGESFGANLLERDRHRDLALLVVTVPQHFNWEKQCLASPDEQKRGTPVWFVGRNGQWYVPVLNGAISSLQLDVDSFLTADMPQLQSGSSGAPLITGTGIIGMVKAQGADDTRVLYVESIKTIVQGWNYPWDLTRKGVVLSPVAPPPHPEIPVAPSTGIPLPGLGAPVVSFFEGPHDTLPERSTRVYSYVFSKAGTRSIYWEINLNFSRPGQPVNFKLMAHWVKPDGSEMGQQPLDAAVTADATTYSNSLGWGWVDAGNWPLGTHRVDFYLGDMRVASGSFEISNTPVPQASGFGIPGLKTPVVQFYEGPHDTTPEKNTRVYRNIFPRSSTRAIYWEVDLNFPKPSHRINFKLTAHWIKPDGTEMGQQTLDGYVVPEWGTSWHSLGYGWVNAGNWPIGTHRVDFYVGSTLVASGSFQIN